MHHLIRNWIKKHPDSLYVDTIVLKKGSIFLYHAAGHKKNKPLVKMPLNYTKNNKPKITKKDYSILYCNAVRMMTVIKNEIYVMVYDFDYRCACGHLYVKLEDFELKLSDKRKPIINPLIVDREYSGNGEIVKIKEKIKNKIKLYDGRIFYRKDFKKQYNFISNETAVPFKKLKLRDHDFPIDIEMADYRNNRTYYIKPETKNRTFNNTIRGQFSYFSRLLKQNVDPRNFEVGIYDRFSNKLIGVEPLCGLAIQHLSGSYRRSELRFFYKQYDKYMTWGYGFAFNGNKVVILKTISAFCKYKLKYNSTRMYKCEDILKKINEKKEYKPIPTGISYFI